MCENCGDTFCQYGYKTTLCWVCNPYSYTNSNRHRAFEATRFGEFKQDIFEKGTDTLNKLKQTLKDKGIDFEKYKGKEFDL